MVAKKPSESWLCFYTSIADVERVSPKQFGEIRTGVVIRDDAVKCGESVKYVRIWRVVHKRRGKRPLVEEMENLDVMFDDPMYGLPPYRRGFERRGRCTSIPR